MHADYVMHMGTDMTVVNAARVSFNKDTDYNLPIGEDNDDDTVIDFTKFELSERDVRLIRYLARNSHWTPFAHPHATFRMTAPIFVARQAFKHKVGFVENEVSRRYVKEEPKLYLPANWRGAPTNGAKQGSDRNVSITDLTIPSTFFGDSAHRKDGIEPKDYKVDLSLTVQKHYQDSINLYNIMIESGVAPEQARMVLPQSMYTSWYWTGSLIAWARFCNQRIHPHAQAEITELADIVEPIMRRLFPVSWPEIFHGGIANYGADN